eukprot:scaffold4177_cov37-Phaeocystis_antarctica.AAC.1
MGVRVRHGLTCALNFLRCLTTSTRRARHSFCSDASSLSCRQCEPRPTLASRTAAACGCEARGREAGADATCALSAAVGGAVVAPARAAARAACSVSASPRAAAAAAVLAASLAASSAACRLPAAACEPPDPGGRQARVRPAGVSRRPPPSRSSRVSAPGGVSGNRACCFFGAVSVFGLYTADLLVAAASKRARTAITRGALAHEPCRVGAALRPAALRPQPTATGARAQRRTTLSTVSAVLAFSVLISSCTVMKHLFTLSWWSRSLSCASVTPSAACCSLRNSAAPGGSVRSLSSSSSARRACARLGASQASAAPASHNNAYWPKLAGDYSGPLGNWGEPVPRALIELYKGRMIARAALEGALGATPPPARPFAFVRAADSKTRRR